MGDKDSRDKFTGSPECSHEANIFSKQGISGALSGGMQHLQ
jgi:hypothetical protein